MRAEPAGAPSRFRSLTGGKNADHRAVQITGPFTGRNDQGAGPVIFLTTIIKTERIGHHARIKIGFKIERAILENGAWIARRILPRIEGNFRHLLFPDTEVILVALGEGRQHEGRGEHAERVKEPRTVRHRIALPEAFPLSLAKGAEDGDIIGRPGLDGRRGLRDRGIAPATAAAPGHGGGA